VRKIFTKFIKRNLGITLGGFHHYNGPHLSSLPIKKPSFPSQSSLKFLIVTPSYNQGRFIRETVNSVLTQDYPFFEYIIQDCCSTDETQQFLCDIADRRLKVFFEKDNGQSDAINRGFSRSSGDIMFYLNSDDLILPHTFEYISSIFATHPDLDVIYADRLIIDEEGRIIGDWRLPEYNPAVVKIIDYIPQETLFWRRRLWDKVGGLDASLEFAMDWDLILRFEAANAQIVHIPEFLGAFRAHPNQKTQASTKIGKKEMRSVCRRYTGPLERIKFKISYLHYLSQHVKINKVPVPWQNHEASWCQ